MPQEADFKGPASVDRDRQADDSSGLAVDVMAAVDTQQSPAVPLDQASEITAGQRLHTVISRTRSLPPGLGSGTSTDKQPSTASYKFVKSSSKVSPWVAQPGMAGTSAQKPPSSASCTTTLIFKR